MDIRIDNTVEMVPIDSIKPYGNNAKLHPEKQIKALAKHIKKVGWDQPIVIDEDSIILKGHARQLVGYHLKMEEVPVVRKVGLTEAQKKACRLADNKLAESEWDVDTLRLELLEMRELDESLEELGWDDKELKKLGLLDDVSDISEKLEPADKAEFLVIIECRDEMEQQELFEELKGRDYVCKLM